MQDLIDKWERTSKELKMAYRRIVKRYPLLAKDYLIESGAYLACANDLKKKLKEQDEASDD